MNGYPEQEPLLPQNTNVGQHVQAELKGTKAWVGAVLAFITAVATGLTELFPDPTVSLVLKVIILVSGTAGTAFGVYQTRNEPKAS